MPNREPDPLNGLPDQLTGEMRAVPPMVNMTEARLQRLYPRTPNGTFEHVELPSTRDFTTLPFSTLRRPFDQESSTIAIDGKTYRILHVRTSDHSAVIMIGNGLETMIMKTVLSPELLASNIEFADQLVTRDVETMRESMRRQGRMHPDPMDTVEFVFNRLSIGYPGVKAASIRTYLRDAHTTLMQQDPARENDEAFIYQNLRSVLRNFPFSEEARNLLNGIEAAKNSLLREENNLRRIAEEDRELVDTIPTTHGFIQDKTTGETYILMDYYPGPTYDLFLDRPLGQEVEPEARLTVFKQIAKTVGLLHKDHYIHGDLKPANVIVTADGIKLLDFGMSRHTTEGLQNHLTGWGTAPYAAPELYGEGLVDKQSDVYALGVMLYEAYTGKMHTDGPFPFTNAPLTDDFLVDRIIRNATNPHKEERYNTAEEFVNALELII